MPVEIISVKSLGSQRNAEKRMSSKLKSENEADQAAVRNSMALRNRQVSPIETVIELKDKPNRLKWKRKVSSSGSVGTNRDQKKPKTFIAKHFKKRECFKYIERHDDNGNPVNPPLCDCGLVRRKHPKDVVNVTGRDAEWSVEKCTRRVPTDTYGEINFMQDDSNSKKPYVRISDDTKAKHLIALMRREWKLELPNLVISVTGGAKSFNLKPRLKDVFTKGLIKVAVSTGAWIITGGTNAGVMKHVGEAVKNSGMSNMARSKINTIGIAPWGVLGNSEELVSKTGDGLYPANYEINDFDTGTTGLDCNHSYFLLVDSGETGKYGTEIKLRSRVEGAISEYTTKSNSEKGSIGIPVVILCLEGGPNTIKTMVEAVKRGTPAVVIDGSGRAADVVSFAYNHLEDAADGTKQIAAQYINEVQAKVGKVFGDKNMMTVYGEIESLLKDEKMITVFKLDDNGGKTDMDLAILTALLKANKASFEVQLKLALAWNRIDVAKSEIFTDDLKRNEFKVTICDDPWEKDAFQDVDVKFQVELLYDSMTTALVDDKPDFVDLFLHEGVNLKHYLTLEVLEKLYNLIPKKMAINHVIVEFLDKSRDDTPPTDMRVIGFVLEKLMGDRYKSPYKREKCYTREGNDEYEVTDRKESTVSQLMTGDNRKNEPHELLSPYLDLFTWSVLCDRPVIAHLIWERTHDSIGAALMASKVLKGLANEVSDDKELSDSVPGLLELARSYELKAVGVLEECRHESDKLAQALLVKRLPHFGGGLTSVDIAVSADDQDFIAHTSCQTLFNRLWMGELNINTETVKVLICIFIPFAIHKLIKFHKDMDHHEQQNQGEYDETFTNAHAHEKDNDDNFNNMLMNGSLGASEFSLQKDLSRNNSEDMLKRIPNDEAEMAEEQTQQKQDDDDNDDDLECDHEHVDFLGVDTKTGYFKRIFCFHDAPFVKFSVNVISYAFFLLLYAFVILTRFNLSVHPSEFVLQGWVFTLFCEEIRQFATQEPKHFTGKVEFYFQDPWNIADCAGLVGFITATVLRYVAYETNTMKYLHIARIIYSSDIIIFILRLLQIFSVNRHMGPKLVMIRRMLDDLVYFVFILAVFIIGYGVATQAVLFPNSDLWEAIVGVLNKPYWQMYGELFADDFLETKLNCTTGEPLCMGPNAQDDCLDDYGQYVAPVYMALYMLLTNILLLNLLIAIFNYTFEKIQETSDKVWKFQRYDLIREYRDRPALCPPFIIIAHIYFFFKWIAEVSRCCGCKPDSGSSLEMELFANNFTPEELVAQEQMASEAYNYKTTELESETQDERVKTILHRVNALSEEIEQIKYGEISLAPVPFDGGGRSSNRPETRAGGPRTRTNSQIDNRMFKLEQNVDRILEMLIQQNRMQAEILEASNKIMQQDHSLPSSSSSSLVLKDSARKPNIKARITTLHTKSRLSPYPGSMVQRFKVTDDNVLWEVEFTDYRPVNYTAPVVLSKPYWADIDLMTIVPRPVLKFNAYDDEHRVNRISHFAAYEVIDGLPLNPFGRTGMKGRGSLGRFGPNHAADPIATRWKRTSSGVMIDNGKKVLEFIAIQRRDNHQWAIPGGMVEPGEHVSETLRKEFTEEALAKLNMPDHKRKMISDRIAYLFRNGVEVYKGYVDDPRNTDNAWMETVACNFHDDTGEIFGEFQLQAGDDAQAVRWQRVSGNIPLFASHVGILEQVAKMHGAAFH